MEFRKQLVKDDTKVLRYHEDLRKRDFERTIKKQQEEEKVLRDKQRKKLQEERQLLKDMEEQHQKYLKGNWELVRFRA